MNKKLSARTEIDGELGAAHTRYAQHICELFPIPRGEDELDLTAQAAEEVADEIPIQWPCASSPGPPPGLSPGG